MTYACHNRPPYAESFPAQDGWTQKGTRSMVLIPFRMAQECIYQANDKLDDPQCVGCRWKDPPYK